MLRSNGIRRLASRYLSAQLRPNYVSRNYSKEKCYLPDILVNPVSVNDRTAKEWYRILGVKCNASAYLTRETSFARHQQFCSEAGSNNSEEEQKISVTFVDKDGEEHHIKVPLGMSMLEAAHQNDIDLEGACEGSLACSTCHVIVMDVDYYNKLEDPSDEENDMLDLAFGLTETSRLGCQIVAKPELDGIRLALPAATRNFAVDGYKPKPH
ncbi:PREDICTED: adrenodoxin-like protein 2, mitochondrial isoform X2 [Ipomoea nil]|uniref:adrenodoxin-like protein 2, mitochondrial isoform X2 n=1 Tax=Ipomoea nil TaxID=35883 RepID=UPI0009009584|nr:PREDICTED: adrenodoxin-like protein 2, mitochondrial isoform X2 [Ipomoea nil]